MSLPTISAVLLDIEGTLYANGRAIDGARDTLEVLREQGVALRFLTNIDSLPPETIAAELSGLGLGIAPRDLFTPVSAACAVIGAAAHPRVYGLLSTALRPAVPHVVSAPPYTHVLIGDCRDVLDYPRLDAAFRAVRDGAELLALQRGRYFKRPDGDHLDTGGIVAGLEYATGVRARVLGKPNREFFALAAASLGVELAQCVVVGDDATTDIAGGRDAGAVTVQVRTGKYADQAGEGLTGRAHRTLDSIAELPAMLKAAGR